MPTVVADKKTGELPSRKFRPVAADFKDSDSWKEGDAVEGWLRAKSTVDVQNGTIGKYTIEQETGKLLAFLGGTILDDAMALIDVGAFVRVTFDRVEKRAGGKTLKHFNVEVADD